MRVGIRVSIDVTKIEKSRLYKGKKGTYLDLTTFINTGEEDMYGNHGFVRQSQKKEELDSGEPETPILGNCRVFFTAESDNKKPKPKEDLPSPEDHAYEDSEIPF